MRWLAVSVSKYLLRRLSRSSCVCGIVGSLMDLQLLKSWKRPVWEIWRISRASRSPGLSVGCSPDRLVGGSNHLKRIIRWNGIGLKADVACDMTDVRGDEKELLLDNL